MRRSIFATVLISLACASVAHPQAVDLRQNRVAMTDLHGPWRFHAGDNPAWANPGYDDSSWSLLMAGKPWGEQGYRGYSGVGWYRLRVAVPAHSGPLAIYFPDVEDCYQVFANGRMIGQVGELPPHPKLVESNRNMFRIPMDTMVQGQPLMLAARVWGTSIAGPIRGGFDEVPRIGDASQIVLWRKLQSHYVVSLVSGDIAELYGNILTALAGLGLFLLRPKERGYLWWGMSQMLWSVFIVLNLWSNFRTSPYFSTYVLIELVSALALYFQFEFYVTFLRQSRGWLYWSTVVSIVAGLGLTYMFVWAPATASNRLLAAFSGTLTQSLVVALLWRGGRGNRIDAALLLIPNCVMLALHVLSNLCSLPAFSSTHWAFWIVRLLSRAIYWPFRMSAFDVVGLVEMYAVLVILLRSYVRTSQDEERLESELEAARAVQKVLIPDEVPAIPGFAVETVYHPASQVGGDFFQIVPLNSGGALIVIGDVSGKGMPAAMTVSLLVGTVRTLAHYTQSPGEILAAMNQRMLARSSGGFTTCLVMRIDLDGTLTAANAGHLAPYLNGAELKLENGLPLGLAAETQYAESTFRLATPSRLTLLTDGVVESRNHHGELFGFDRTRAISTEAANQIANAAEQFGQEDDITVLTLTLAAAEALHA
ncbi:MAG: SpoIIE family protein phosphatase [Terracidiphilus sp.]